MARRVARRVDHRHRHSRKIEDLAIAQIHERGGDRWTLKARCLGAKERTQLLPWVASHIDVVRMDVRNDAGSCDSIDSSCVVDMTVCQEQRHRRQVELGQQVADALGVRRCVNDDSWLPTPGCDDVRIRAEVPKRSRFDQHTCPLPRSEHKAVRVVHGFDITESVEHQIESVSVGELYLVSKEGDPVTAGHGGRCVDVRTDI